MSLRILFADDSMTAQNMGKKILTEAGYEVVAVSNGAAAVKKIAEHKPDIIILDVYMPGYSGLEVCEKVRSSIDTLKTPVLLTVGKMEPYKPEDANRVKADGVIIKPFEASDLVAIVKKLEERISPSPVPPLVQQTVRLERPPDFAEFAVHSAGNLSSAAVAATPDELGENTVHPTVDVPDHMATVSAFSDLLGTDTLAPVESSAPLIPEFQPEPAPTSVATFLAPAPASISEVAPAPAWNSAGTDESFAINPEPSLVVEAPPFITPDTTQPIVVETIAIAPTEAPEAEEAASLAPSQSSVPANSDGVYPDTQPIPVYEEPEAQPVQVELIEVRPEPTEVVLTEATTPLEHSFEPTQAAAVTESNNGIELGLEPTIQEQAEVAPVTDPNLVSDKNALEVFPTRFGVQSPEEVPVGIASDLPVFDSSPVAEQATVEAEQVETDHVRAEPAVAVDDDFEARVSAAMNLYTEPRVTELGEAPEVETPEIQTPEVETPEVQTEETRQPAVMPANPEVDFEARVAAAMSFYEEPQPTAAFADEVEAPAIQETAEAALATPPEPVAEPPVEEFAALHSRIEVRPVEAEPVAIAAEQPPSFEYSPPVTEPLIHHEPEVRPEPQIDSMSAVEPEVVAEQQEQDRYIPSIKSEVAPFLQPVAKTVAEDVNGASVSPDSVAVAIAPEASTPEIHATEAEQIAASVEAEMPVEAVTAAAVATGADHEIVAQVVHRVMERLKPELIAAIVRELNSQK
ncbi:MAG TPA: response regulator [Candidatus Angelobacter sp.]|nr:response regulator [Candidatus Angelobacter sp.]